MHLASCEGHLQMVTCLVEDYFAQVSPKDIIHFSNAITIVTYCCYYYYWNYQYY